ncbi:phage major capsid protein [Mycetocola tolaasinivorans]|uniref:Phage major capsid protein n=1 Tax=Mycetocola tolaasinivorans TaxID=76635 RepID=A0A3L7A2H5_9MICO|nr:phage major capsid protein [Mycetocola tolaasinivorans]RLP74357.1 phage major capsid protein [Mycetocola tolaasinivorans]
MAQTKPTTTGDFAGFIQPDQAGDIFAEVRRGSVAQQLARQIPVGANGVAIPYTTSKPKAGWVAEGAKKPTTSGGKALRTIKPHKLAAITVVSAETVRANPGGYITDLYADLAEAFAIAFDAAALHGTDSPFGAGNYLAATTKAVTLGTAAATKGGLHADLNAGLSLLVADKKKLTGFAFDSVAEPLFNDAVDANGRPLFIDSPLTETSAIARGGRVLGRQAFLGDGVGLDPVVGFGGDWTKAVWGVVGGITYDVSTQAAVTIDGQLVSLFENNLVAIRAEAEYGWDVADVASFVKYNDAAGA